MIENELMDCRIVVTGGASGMGEGVVRGLPQRSARIVSIDINTETGSAIAREAGAHFVQADVSDPDGIRHAFDDAVAVLGGIDVLIHAAGVAPGARAEQTSYAEWQRVMAINATGTFLANQAVFPHLVENGGTILNFASSAGVKGYSGKAAYAASKGAVIAWTRSVAAEWGRYNIRVNCIAPAIWTPMYDKTRAAMSPEQRNAHDAALRIGIPIGGKLGNIETDLVPVVAFLASEAAHFITGQVIPVDGGALMMR